MTLLVATDFDPNAAGGGPSVVRQMLKGFRAAGHRIHWWSCRRSSPSGQQFAVDGVSQAALPAKLMPARRIPQLKARILSRIWAPYAASSLRWTIKSVQPDCVWAIPHNWSILPLYRILALRRSRRFRLHTTIQDYPDIHGNELVWGEEIATSMTSYQLRLYSDADTRDATSLEMLDDLKQRTGMQGSQMLHEGLEREDFDRILKPLCERSSAPLRLAFAGTILAEEAFSNLVAALRLVAGKQKNITLDFWGAHSYRHKHWFDPTWMSEHSNCNRDQLVESLSTCDWGCLAMPLDPLSSRYARFSFPTKFITYLAAGIPTVLLARTDSSVGKMLHRFGVGLLLSESSPEEMADTLRTTLWKFEYRQRLRSRMVRCAEEHFHADKKRAILWGDLVGRNPTR